MDDEKRKMYAGLLQSLFVGMQKDAELMIVNIECVGCSTVIPCIEGKNPMMQIFVLGEETIYPKRAVAVDKMLFCGLKCAQKFQKGLQDAVNIRINSQVVYAGGKTCPKCQGAMLDLMGGEDDRTTVRGRECTLCGYGEGDV